MSQRNVEVVKECYELFGKGDLEGILRYLDPKAEVVESPTMPDARTFHGHDGFIDAIGHWAGEFEDFRVEIERLIDAGDTVITLVRQTARGRQSDVPVKTRVGNVITFRDRLVLKWEMFVPPEAALEAVGLRE